MLIIHQEQGKPFWVELKSTFNFPLLVLPEPKRAGDPRSPVIIQLVWGQQWCHLFRPFLNPPRSGLSSRHSGETFSTVTYDSFTVQLGAILHLHFYSDFSMTLDTFFFLNPHSRVCLLILEREEGGEREALIGFSHTRPNEA